MLHRLTMRSSPSATIPRVGGAEIERKVVGYAIADIEEIARSYAIDHRDRKSIEHIVSVGIDTAGIVGNIEPLQAELEGERKANKAVFELSEC